MNMRAGIVSVGAHVPRYRLTGALLAGIWGGSASGERAVANYDEDALTMACEAAMLPSSTLKNTSSAATIPKNRSPE